MTVPVVVTVITVNLNGRDLTPACLASIPPGVETIVVDNGSTDGSADEIAARFPAAVLIRNRANLGFARAVNQAMLVAKGARLCILHNDAVLGPGALEKLSAELYGGVGVAVPHPKAGCLMSRRDVLDRVGPIDERLFFAHELEDWMLRAVEAGSRIAQAPDASVAHPGGGTRRQSPVRARIESERSRFALLRKHRPARHALVRIFHPLCCLAEFLFCTAAIFVRGMPRRWLESAAVFAWQVCGCPRGWGLSAAAVPPYLRLRDGWVVAGERLEGFGDFDRHFGKAKVVKDYKYKKTLACTVGDRTYLVKVYKRAGWLRRIKNAVLGSRAQHEIKMCLGILERGIPTVPVVAVGERNAGSCVVFEHLADWSQLQEVLLSDATPPSRRRSLLRAYGRFARWVQDLGVWQYDFNPTNVLVKDSSFKLIDFERVRLRPGAVPAPERLYLLAKMNRIPKLSRTDRLRFLRGYTDAHAAEGERLGDLAREVLRRGERQKDADLDHAADRSLQENRDFARFETGEVDGFHRRVRADRLGDGVELETVLGLARGAGAAGFRLEPASDAIGAWQEANRRAKEGGPLPLAVFRRRGEIPGTLVYRS